MKLIEKIKETLSRFFSGAFDYDQPTAGGGCCGCVEVDPEVRKEYRKVSLMRNKSD